MKTSVTLNLRDLKDLIADEDSCVVVSKQCCRNDSFLLKQTKNLKQSLKESLDTRIGSYDSELNGIILSFKNIKIDPFTKVEEDGYLSVTYKADVYIFSPKLNSVLKGVVNNKSDDHVGVLVHKIFNVVIPCPPNIIFRNWAGSQLNIGDEIVFKVSELEFNSPLPYIRGSLLDSFSETKCDLTDSGIEGTDLHTDDLNPELDLDEITELINPKQTFSENKESSTSPVFETFKMFTRSKNTCLAKESKNIVKDTENTQHKKRPQRPGKLLTKEKSDEEIFPKETSKISISDKISKKNKRHLSPQSNVSNVLNSLSDYERENTILKNDLKITRRKRKCQEPNLLAETVDKLFTHMETPSKKSMDSFQIFDSEVLDHLIKNTSKNDSSNGSFKTWDTENEKLISKGNSNSSENKDKEEKSLKSNNSLMEQTASSKKHSKKSNFPKNDEIEEIKTLSTSQLIPSQKPFIENSGYLEYKTEERKSFESNKFLAKKSTSEKHFVENSSSSESDDIEENKPLSTNEVNTSQKPYKRTQKFLEYEKFEEEKSLKSNKSPAKERASEKHFVENSSSSGNDDIEENKSSPSSKVNTSLNPYKSNQTSSEHEKIEEEKSLKSNKSPVKTKASEKHFVENSSSSESDDIEENKSSPTSKINPSQNSYKVNQTSSEHEKIQEEKSLKSNKSPVKKRASEKHFVENSSSSESDDIEENKSLATGKINTSQNQTSSQHEKIEDEKSLKSNKSAVKKRTSKKPFAENLCSLQEHNIKENQFSPSTKVITFQKSIDSHSKSLECTDIDKKILENESVIKESPLSMIQAVENSSFSSEIEGYQETKLFETNLPLKGDKHKIHNFKETDNSVACKNDFSLLETLKTNKKKHKKKRLNTINMEENENLSQKKKTGEKKPKKREADDIISALLEDSFKNLNTKLDVEEKNNNLEISENSETLTRFSVDKNEIGEVKKRKKSHTIDENFRNTSLELESIPKIKKKKKKYEKDKFLSDILFKEQNNFGMKKVRKKHSKKKNTTSLQNTEVSQINNEESNLNDLNTEQRNKDRVSKKKSKKSKTNYEGMENFKVYEEQTNIMGTKMKKKDKTDIIRKEQTTHTKSKESNMISLLLAKAACDINEIPSHKNTHKRKNEDETCKKKPKKIVVEDITSTLLRNAFKSINSTTNLKSETFTINSDKDLDLIPQQKSKSENKRKKKKIDLLELEFTPKIKKKKIKHKKEKCLADTILQADVNKFKNGKISNNKTQIKREKNIALEPGDVIQTSIRKSKDVGNKALLNVSNLKESYLKNNNKVSEIKVKKPKSNSGEIENLTKNTLSVQNKEMFNVPSTNSLETIPKSLSKIKDTKLRRKEASSEDSSNIISLLLGKAAFDITASPTHSKTHKRKHKEKKEKGLKRE